MLKIALIIGGHNPGHKRQPNTLADIIENAEISILNLSCHNLKEIGLYDIVMVNTSLESASEMQLHELSSYLSLPNKILFLIHEAAIYNRHYSFFNKKIGVRFNRHLDYGNVVIKKEHEHLLLTGVDDTFETIDELYFFDDDTDIYRMTDDVLLSEFETGQPVFYERKIPQSNSVLYYISLGHDNITLTNKNFKIIIQNMICWAHRLHANSG